MSILLTNAFMKQSCFVLFCRIEISPLTNHHASCHALGIFGKLSMSRGALTWFETVWSYGVESIDY
jgi:hypothetical protein